MEAQELQDKDLVTVAEFRRRILERDRKKDPLARMISRDNIEAKIAAGYIQTEEHNGRKWIDWNAYKHIPFRAYLSMPERKVADRTITTRREVIAIYEKPINKDA